MPSVPVSVPGSAVKMTLHVNGGETVKFGIHEEP